MSAARELAETLLDVADALLVAIRGTEGLHATRMEVVLPLQIGTQRRGAEVRLLGDVPRTHLTSEFDPVVSRFRVVWEELTP